MLFIQVVVANNPSHTSRQTAPETSARMDGSTEEYASIIMSTLTMGMLGMALEKLNSNFLRIPFVLSALALSAILIFPASAFPLSIQLWTGKETVKFSKGSWKLSDSSKVQLARHIPRINAFNVEIVLIVATGDGVKSSSSMDRTIDTSLAEARANAVRQFFIDAGYSPKIIISETKVFSVTDKNFRYSLGTANIEYIGPCKPGYVSICDEQP